MQQSSYLHNPTVAEYLGLLTSEAEEIDKIGERYPDSYKREENIKRKNKKIHSKRLTNRGMAETKPSSKTLETQRTFDSTDDLLASSSDSDGEDDLNHDITIDDGGANNGEQQPAPSSGGHHHRQHHIHHSPRPHPSKSLWDCKAVRWPPHHPNTIIKAGLRYIKDPFHLLEIVVLGVFLLGCYKLPGKTPVCGTGSNSN